MADVTLPGELPITPTEAGESKEMPLGETKVTILSVSQEGSAGVSRAETGDATNGKESLPRRSSKLEEFIPGPNDVCWNWMHRTGWKPYDAKSQKIIERAYRAGEAKVRLKTGKRGTTPMEIFFEDLIQFDPETKNQREVQRAGPIYFHVKLERTINAIRKWIETGKPPRESFAQYQARREAESAPREEYDVTAFYWETGCFSYVASSSTFFSVSMLVVLFNAFWIAIDLDHNPADVISQAEVQFQVVEYALCAFFTIELIIRFGAFKHKRNCLRDAWFMFDFALVLLAVFESWIVPLMLKVMQSSSTGPSMFRSFAALRMLRLMRLTKLFRAIPQLLTIVKGISAAVSSMLVTCLLLLILMFVFGVIFRSVLKTKPDIQDHFGSVSQSAWTLLLYGTLLDAPGDLMTALWDAEPMMSWVFLFYIFLSSFTVLNMLIGVLCEVVGQVSAAEKEDADQRFLANNLTDILQCYDKNEDGRIGRDEFDLIMGNLEVRELLHKFGTDVEGLKALKDHMFSDAADHDDKLRFDEFLHQINVLKGDTPAKVTDIIEFREYVRMRLDDVCSMRQAPVVEGKTIETSQPPLDRVLARLDQLSEERAEDRRALEERVERLERAVHQLSERLER